MMGQSKKLIKLVVYGETYGCVKSISYLGDTFDGDGGCPLSQK